MSDLSIKTRFCPSPTGRLHIGNIRTALFSALWAHGQQGKWLLRIEDTDQERSTAALSEQLQADLKWLGLHWDEGPDVGGPNAPYYQSERGAIYDEYYAALETNHLAYPCFCSQETLAQSRQAQIKAHQAPRYDGTCANLKPDDVQAKLAEGVRPTLRFRVPPAKTVSFVDAVRGLQHFKTHDLGDFIIRRADGSPGFLFCNAIDDALMGVTHVLRGEDHLSNSPLQILILQALDLPIPQYVHMSLIVGDDGSPLSKRHGSFNIGDLQKEGYLPGAIVNYLAHLGHHYQEEGYQSLDELAKGFRLASLGQAPARFDKKQLAFYQKAALLELADKDLWNWLGESVHAVVPPEKQAIFVAAVRPNLMLPQEGLSWAKAFFGEHVIYEQAARDAAHEAGLAFYQAAFSSISDVASDEAISHEALLTLIKEATSCKGKALFAPLRAGLTGTLHGPGFADIFQLMGIEKIRQRFEQAIENLP